MTRKILGSSAKIKNLQLLTELHRSLMNKLKRRGPRIEPRGTSEITWKNRREYQRCEPEIVCWLRNCQTRPCHNSGCWCWLPIAAARAWTKVMSCGICSGQSGTGLGFLQVLLFPVPILISPTAPHSSSSSIIRGWYNRSISGRRTKWTQSHPTARN
jgi:hypothetical protein